MLFPFKISVCKNDTALTIALSSVHSRSCGNGQKLSMHVLTGWSNYCNNNGFFRTRLWLSCVLVSLFLTQNTVGTLKENPACFPLFTRGGGSTPAQMSTPDPGCSGVLRRAATTKTENGASVLTQVSLPTTACFWVREVFLLLNWESSVFNTEALWGDYWPKHGEFVLLGYNSQDLAVLWVGGTWEHWSSKENWQALVWM